VQTIVSRHWISILIILLLIAIFSLSLSGLTQDSFWSDEGFSAWLVRDEMRPPESAREILSFVRDSFVNTFDRVRDDVHPALYYFLLDGWSLLAGETEFVLRLPSALMGILALAATYAIGAQCFNRKVGLMSLILLGTSGFFLYYSREARMYGIYLALATLATWAYSRWWHRPTIAHGILYGFIGALLLYTHYTSFTILLAHLIHALITIRTWKKQASLLQIALPYALIAILFTPWLPFAIQQFQLNTGFVAAGALSSDVGTIAALWLILSSGYWGIFALILLLTLPNFRKISNHALSLILLWAIVPPTTLLLANAQGLSIFQLRYVISIVPAWCLLLAYGLSLIKIPFIKIRWLNIAVSIFFLLWIAYTQLATYRQFWSEKPRWREAVQAASNSREATEPTLVYLDEKSPLAYYDRQFNLLQGISINISWRNFLPQEIFDTAATLNNAESVWAIVAMQAPESWDTIAALSQNRGVSYRDSVQWTTFYRFDTESDEELSFTFSDLLAYRGEFYQEYTVSPDNELCVAISLEALKDIPENYSIGLQLTRGYNELVAQNDEGLGAYTADDIIERELCLNVPEKDTYHLRLLIYDWRTIERLPLLENELLWGDYLMLGIVLD
jgi:4-amino-4-deoxy-L-arabinose transferase-like glycosyltransferase